MPESLTISPEEMHFQAPYTNSSEVDLNLTNTLSDQYVAFKVKTIHPGRYQVKPTSGVCAPGKTATVKVTFQPLASQEQVAAFAKTKQKFMVQYRTVNGTPQANETAATLMAKADSGQMIEKKVDCRFDFDNANEHGGGTPGGTGAGGAGGGTGTPAADDGVNAFHSSSDAQAGQVSGCPIGSRCLRFLLVALLVLLIAVALGYQFGDKVKDAADKVKEAAEKAAEKAAHEVNSRYEQYRTGR